MTLLRTSLLALSGLALVLGLSTGAGANDISVPQGAGIVQEARSTWAPGFTHDGSQYVRTNSALEGSGMMTRVQREERSTWHPEFRRDDDGRYVRESIVQMPAPGANVAHFDRHYSAGAVRDDEQNWVHFD